MHMLSFSDLQSLISYKNGYNRVYVDVIVKYHLFPLNVFELAIRYSILNSEPDGPSRPNVCPTCSFH